MAANQKIRIFVSYASNAQDSRKYLDAVIQGINLVADATAVSALDFKSGHDWHEAIGKAIGSSHGAIFLLSPEAIKSEWVQREATRVDERKRTDPGTYLLVPIFAGIRSSALKEAPWNELEFPKIHAIAGYSSVDELTSLVRTSPQTA